MLLEAAQIADTDSQRFQERYLFTLMPLLATAFALYVKRGMPGRVPVGLASAVRLLLAARVPLSGYAAAHNKDDSPTLWAVIRLETIVSVGNGALAVALIAAALSCVAALVAFRKLPPVVALVAAIAACCALSAGASSFDTHTSRGLRHSLPHDLRWVDHARLGSVDLLAPPGALREQSWQQLFWNTSVHAATRAREPTHRPLLDGASGREPRRNAPRRRSRRPAAATRANVRLDAATDRRRARAARNRVGSLSPDRVPRLRLIAAGRFADNWLTPAGAITVWTKRSATLELVLALPPNAQTTTIRFTAGKVGRVVRVQPGRRIALQFRVPGGGGAWSLRFKTTRHGYLGDRAVSVRAPVVRLG